MRQAALAGFSGLIAAVGILSGTISTAQQPQQLKSLQFEVATIKPGNPKVIGSSTSGGAPGGRFRMVNMPLERWVEMGLSVRTYALRAPSWLDTSRFDLDAKVPADTPVDDKSTGEMIKALLIERFGLKWHEELQNVSGYELVTDKKVLVKPTGLLERMRGHGSSSGPTSIGGTDMSMSELAKALEEVVGRPVVDATHLSGGFDIKLMWSPSDDAVAAEEKRHGIDADNLPTSVPSALREQLGLRLQTANVPSKVAVVDHINRDPTEN